MDRVLEEVRRQAKRRERERDRARGERWASEARKSGEGGSKTQGCVPAGNHASG